MSNYYKSGNGCLTAVVYAILFYLLLVIFDLIFAYPFMLLWNWLMPAIFGLKVLTYWESLGLMILCGMLFKSSNVNTKTD